MSFGAVTEFEKQIADFYGAPYAVAVDCATHALELALIHTRASKASCPVHTYLSIPMTFMKLNLDWEFTTHRWINYYSVTSNVIDAAVFWEKDGYVKDTFMCLSFQFKKHLSLSRGGMILCPTLDDYNALKKLSHDGRSPNAESWHHQDIDSIGYHYYMTPEVAQAGLDKLPNAIARPAISWDWLDYPNLTTKTLFKDAKVV